MDNKTINMNDDEVEIDLLQLFRALKKRILWIVGAGVIMGGAFGLFSKFAITPQYTSTSMVYILSKGFFRNYPFLCFPTYLSFASNKRFLQRPYIVRFIIFNRLFVPSTKPLL